jgi:hypothetical protein
LNAKERQLAFEFLLRNSLGALVLIRIVMEPLRQYLGKQFQPGWGGVGVCGDGQRSPALNRSPMR